MIWVDMIWHEMIRDVHVQTEYVEMKLTEQCIVRNWGERATSLGSRSSQTAHSETSAKQRHCKSGDMPKEAQGTKRHKTAQMGTAVHQRHLWITGRSWLLMGMPWCYINICCSCFIMFLEQHTDLELHRFQGLPDTAASRVELSIVEFAWLEHPDLLSVSFCRKGQAH